MKIQMTRTVLGQDQTDSGAALRQKRYIDGEIYVVGESLGKTLLDMKAAKLVDEKPAAAKKSKGAAPENKEA